MTYAPTISPDKFPSLDATVMSRMYREAVPLYEPPRSFQLRFTPVEQ